MQGRDPDAIAAWQAALDGRRAGGNRRAAADRRATCAGATARAPPPLDQPNGRPARPTATGLGAPPRPHRDRPRGRRDRACSTRTWRKQPDDAEAQWLLLHALYRATCVEQGRAASASASRPTRAATSRRQDGTRARRRVAADRRTALITRPATATSCVLSGGGAGGFPSRLQRIGAGATSIVTLGRSTLTSSVRVRLVGSGFDE